MTQLFEGFRNPPRRYSPRAFWFWNGRITPDDVRRQIVQMVEQGVYGAFVHARSGLKVPYLSEGWFALIQAGLEEASRHGFLFGICDEFNWPAGEARDYAIHGLPSRVLQGHPEFRMQSLVPEERYVTGPSAVLWEGLGDAQHVVIGRMGADGRLDDESLTEITRLIGTDGTLRWNAPDGTWLITAFTLRETVGIDGGLVDLLNPDAVRRFIDVVYEEYARRFAPFFGKVLTSVFSDHEGDYGAGIAWTPQLMNIFRERNGYDLAPFLPLLLHDGGRRTVMVRCDYLDVVSDLYAHSFFQQLTDWCRAHNIEFTAHVWEESLQRQASYCGDIFRVQRSIHTPGVDSLFDWGRSPRHFKETASVAHFRSVSYMVENQGVQGVDSYLGLEEMRAVTNPIAAWGPSLWIPHAFNCDPDRVDYPEDWFFHQPYRRYFRHYADYVRRIAWMNDQGYHVADILVYYPIESAFALADAAFRPGPPRQTGRPGWDLWHNEADAIDAAYTTLQEELVAHQRDFDITDLHYLERARVEHGHLVIGPERFRALILPPMLVARRGAIRRARTFFEEGGVVIAVDRLPAASVEGGVDDPELIAEIGALFGNPPNARVHPISRGEARFVQGGAAAVLQVLDELLPRDVSVIDGKRDVFRYQHRIVDGRHVYWVVNDSPDEHTFTVRFRPTGHAERWDAATGNSSPLFYHTTSEGTEVLLRFGPHDAYYVIIDPSGPPQPRALVRNDFQEMVIAGAEGRLLQLDVRTPDDGRRLQYRVELSDGERRWRGEWRLNRALPPITLEPVWRCRLHDPVPAPYAREHLDPNDQGEALGWHLPTYNDSFWQQTWLSPERFTARDWWVIGPFDYDAHRGFDRVFPPEERVDLDATLVGKHGKELRWQRYRASGRVVNLDAALQTQDQWWITAYAWGYVWSPADQDVELRVVADNNVKVWVNGTLVASHHDHPFYIEMRDGFGLMVPTYLKAGWNTILVKVSKANRTRSGAMGFALRFTSTDGLPIPGLRYTARTDEPTPEPPRGRRWYRFAVPPGASGLRLRGRLPALRAYVDGIESRLDENSVITLSPGVRTVALALPAREELPAEPHFLAGEGQITLGSWTHTPLSHYVGSISYEQDFVIPAEYLETGRRLELDCGMVGSVVEAYINGLKVGERVWRPYRFDATSAVKPGRNTLRLVVTNTRAGSRAVGDEVILYGNLVASGPRLLDRLERNGLIGPVRFESVLVGVLPCEEVVD